MPVVVVSISVVVGRSVHRGTGKANPTGVQLASWK